MEFSVQLLPEEKALLDAAARRMGKSQSDLVRQAVSELCRKLARETVTPYSLGQDLFGAGNLSAPSESTLEYQIWEKLRVKHQRLG